MSVRKYDWPIIILVVMLGFAVVGPAAACTETEKEEILRLKGQQCDPTGKATPDEFLDCLDGN